MVNYDGEEDVFFVYWLAITFLLSHSSKIALLEQWYLVLAPWLISHLWSQQATSRKWWSWGWFDSGPACFLRCESLQIISSSLQGEKFLTQMSWAHVAPFLILKHFHMARWLPLLQLWLFCPYLPLLVMAMMRATVMKKRTKALPDRESLMNPWLSSPVISQHSDRPGDQPPDTRLCFGTRTTSFSFMMGVVRAGFLMTSSLVKHLSCIYLIREWVWRIVSILQYQQQ